MLKLSKQQIEALSYKIIEELQAPSKEANDKVMKSEEYKTFESSDEDCKALKRIGETYGLDLSNTIRNVKRMVFDDKFQKVPYFSKENIEREITLQTIDTEDVASLIEKVSQKFK